MTDIRIGGRRYGSRAAASYDLLVNRGMSSARVARLLKYSNSCAARKAASDYASPKGLPWPRRKVGRPKAA